MEPAEDGALPIDDSRAIVPTEDTVVPNLAPAPALSLAPVPSPARAPPTSSQGAAPEVRNTCTRYRYRCPH
jgi:hypothetical protein